MKSPIDTVINDFSSPSDMSNFRINFDGTLTKREGYFELGSFTECVRGTCAVEKTTYAVIGTSFFKLQNSEFSLIGEMSGCSFENDNEKASLFSNGDVIYIIGGGEFYYYDMRKDLFAQYPVYVPLYRKNLNASGDGEYGEAINVISDHRKVHYNVTSDIDYYFPEAAESIVNVYLDNSNVPPDFYSLQSDGVRNFIRLANDEMVVGAQSLLVEYVSKSPSAKLKKQYLSNVDAFLFSDQDETRLFIYGKNTDGKILVAEGIDSTSSPLDPYIGYFPPTSYFSLIDGNMDIYKIFQYNNSILAVTSKGTHQIHKGNNSLFYSKIVSSDFSTTEKSSVAVTDDVCYSFSNNGLFTLSCVERDEVYMAKKVDIPEHLSPGKELFTETRLHLNKLRDELWCCYNDTVAVYNIRYKLWYKFTGIPVDSVFTIAYQTAFSHAGSVFLFDENISTDNDVGFEASYESGIYDLGNIFNKKTIFGFGAVIDNIYGATLDCILKNDKDGECQITVSANRKTGAEKFVKRVHVRLGDSYYVTLRMVSPAGSPPIHIKSIMFRYR